MVHNRRNIASLFISLECQTETKGDTNIHSPAVQHVTLQNKQSKILLPHTSTFPTCVYMCTACVLHVCTCVLHVCVHLSHDTHVKNVQCVVP